MIKNRLGQKRHVLIVDDEKNLTRMLCMLLETRGYNVETAFTAEEALQKVSPELDVIILDLVLPDLSGFDVCRELKQSDRTNHIPIIMLSAHCLHEDKVEALYLGADDFIAKPCEHEELFARMEVVMRRGRQFSKPERPTTPKTVICELRKILDDALIVPHFQPIYLLEPFRFYGIEILTRPVHPGIFSNPEALFEAALQYGLYSELEILSWSMALSSLSKHVRDEKIFLNCNPYFIESAQFLRVKAMLEKNGILSNNVILEITERSAISDFKLFYEQLHNYRDYGFQFAVDDVGGGYASLESIIETKPEVVKIDHHIIKGVTHDPYKQSIVRFIVNFCRENNIFSIAEGIESHEDLQALIGMGINAGQGYYLCRPTPQVDLETFYNIKF